MKAKKALKRLNKVEALLTDVIDRSAVPNQEHLAELLNSAKATVVRARESVNSQMSSRSAGNGPAQTEVAQGTKRPVTVKRKSVNTAPGRRLTKTA